MSASSSTRVRQALELLQMIGIPREQQNERSALTLLALGDIKTRKSWRNTSAPLRRITEMMDWMREHYQVRYAPNTRETIRRQTVHQFVQHGLLIENPDKPDRPINSPHWCYQLSAEALGLLKSFGTPAFKTQLRKFRKNPAASALQARHRDLPRESVRLPDGAVIELSAGGQNTLIRAIVEEFAPRFVRNPKVILLGDAANKEIISDEATMKELGICLPRRGKAPDVLIHDHTTRQKLR